MPLSQNARFSGEAQSESELEHPPGASIARLLQESIAKRGWNTSDIDNWRDCGWIIVCSGDASKLELTLAKMPEGEEWFLQIAPSNTPGFFGRLFGKVVSATPTDIQRLAVDAFAALTETRRFGKFMWLWDGFPEEANSTPEPMSAQSRS